MSRRIHIYKECTGIDCEKKRDPEKTNYWGDPCHDIFVDQGRQFSVCQACGKTDYFRDPDYKKKIGYPHYNASVDKIFDSKDHEKAYAKEHKLESLGMTEKIRDTKF